MTSKTTKFYSTAIAAALVATAVVPAASAADVTATKVSEGKYSITVEAAAKSVVTVYNSTGVSAGTGTVADTGTSVKVEFTYTAGETYTYKVKPADGEESTAKTIEIPTSTALEAAKITVNDSATAKKDTIKITGLDKSAKNVVKVYTKGTDGKTTEFATGTAKKGEAALTIALGEKELNTLRGASGDKATLYFTVQTGTKEVSGETSVEFDLKPVSTALKTEQAYSVNNTTAKDTVTISGVKAKDTVKIYAKTSVEGGKLVAGSKPIQVQKVSKNGAVTIVFQEAFSETLPTDDVFATITSANSYESAPFSVDIAEVTETDAEGAIKAPGEAKPSNLLGTGKDTVTVTGVKNGATVSLYTAATGGTAIASAKANKDGVAVIKVKGGFTADHLKTNGLYYGVANVQSNESVRSAVTVDEEETTKVADGITVSNVAGTTKDTVTITDTGLPAGTVVTVYAAADVTAAIAGTVGVTATTPAKVADGAKVLGKGKIDANGKATVKIAGGLEAHVTDTDKGGIIVTALEKGKILSASAKVTVTAAATTDALEANDVEVFNAKGKKADTVTVKGSKLEQGDVVNLYEATAVDKDSALLATAKPVATVKVATDNADAVLKVKKGFATDKTKGTEKFYVTLAKPNENASKPLAVEVGIEKTSDPVTGITVTYTNNIDLKDTVSFAGLNAKDVVEVFAKSTDTKAIAKATAKNADTLVITLKKDFNKDDTVYYKVTKFNEHQSAATEIKVGAIATQTVGTDFIKKDLITVDDNGTAADATVTVANAKAGVIYTVYNGTTALGTAKAAKDGILVVKLTKGTKYSAIKDAKIDMTARDYTKSESEKVEVKAAATTTNP